MYPDLDCIEVDSEESSLIMPMDWVSIDELYYIMELFSSILSSYEGRMFCAVCLLLL